MYKYSKGINLIAGGEKHRIYVKKSPTGVGKGVKGHVMVNHPTEDKGKWDTIDLTEKAGAKTVEEGKNATKKWHAENSYLSGAKSVKQYRGDENLPEAKNGMKNCGCKHSKAKYKYQQGVDDLDMSIEELYQQEQQSSKLANKKATKVNKKVASVKPVTSKKVETETNSIEREQANLRYKYLKNLEEMSRKQDSAYYANNIGRQIDEAVRNNTRVYVTENREGKPLKGKKSGDNTCITGVCNVAKKAGAKIPFNSYLAENRNAVGDNPIQTRYNPAFRDNAASMGFKLLPQNAKLQKGDIVQLNEKGTPHHAMLYYDEGVAGSRFGNDVGNEDDGRSWFGLGPKKDLGFEKRWMGPFSNRTSSSINPIARNALAYRYMGVPSKRASMDEAIAYGKSEKAKHLKKQELLAKRSSPKELPKNLVASKQNEISPSPEELIFKNGNKSIMSNKLNKYKYKYGTGALMIPEGSAIVTANGGKNKQAIAAYKKGNYKLLNKIIDDMPEDRVSKKQAGDKDLVARYKYLGELTGPLSEEQAKEFAELKNKLSETTYDLYDDKRIAEKFGQKYDVDKAKWKSSLKGGKLNLKEDPDNVKYRNRLRTDPKFFQEQLKTGNVTIDKDGNIAYKSVGGAAPNKMEFLGTSKTGTLPTLDTSLKSSTTPLEETTTGTEDKTKGDNFASNKRKGNFLQNIPSLAEIAARTSILGQGIEGVPENYLKLGRYDYASQLPKTLREIQLAEQTGRETARDMLAGDAGRYLAQAGNLSAASMKAANEAVIQDTLARQDILNKNVDLGNIEFQTNRALKDQYAALRAQARANYNEQLIGLGQRIDSAFETGREMANQRNADEQRMQILRDLGQNYEYKNVNGLMQLVPKVSTNTSTTTVNATGKKGLKKLKTYKRN
jgi:hypothetical protein